MAKNVKITTLPNILDYIAPHSCLGCGKIGSILCDRCKNYIVSQHLDLCPNCKLPQQSHRCASCQSLPEIYTIAPRHGLLDSLVHTYKYDSIRALAPVFADLLNQILPADLPPSTIVVPLPTSTKHIRERGFDHTLLIAKHLARRRGWRVSRAITRAKNTVQVGSDKSARLTQASQAYSLSPKFTPDNSSTYLLLDDVWTTGASMISAFKLLRTTDAADIRLALLTFGL